MGAGIFYKALYWAWVVTEVLVYLRTRTSRASGEVRDRGSMVTLWVTIILALTVGAWMGAVHPVYMFGGARWVRRVSLGVFAAGLGVRWAAIAALGRSFSANVAIHARQTLHTTGLFSLVRHPSYTGLAMIFLALALYPANWTYFVLVLLPTMAALLYRIHVEEDVLEQAFGQQYREYARRTSGWFLLFTSGGFLRLCGLRVAEQLAVRRVVAMHAARFGRVGVRLVAGAALLAAPAWAQNAGAPTGVTPVQPAEPPAVGSPGGPGVPGTARGGPSFSLLPPVPSRTEEGTLHGSDFRIDLPVGSGAEAGAEPLPGRDAGVLPGPNAGLLPGPSAAALPGWNRKLVVYFHGYQSDPQRFRVNPLTHGPNAPSRLIQQLLRRGYAVAQPGYRTGGWVIATAPGDAEALRKYFAKHYGAPRQTFVVGQSMGGLLTVLALEQHAHEYAGGLAICGVLTPADLIMQRAFANRVAFDAFFPGVLPDVEHIPKGFKMNDPGTAALVEKALNAHPPEAALLRSLADIHTNRGLADVLVFNTFVIEDLKEKSGGNPFDNRNLIYTGTTDDNALNAKVRRYAADPQALRYVAEFGSPTGDLRKPLLALHTTYDPLVPASTAGYYDELTRRLGMGERFVQQYVDRDGHCNVTLEQEGVAFDELTQWVNAGVRPVPGRLPDELGQKPVHQTPDVTPAQPKNVGRPE